MNQAFDIDGARKAGYSDAEIAQYLGQQSSFDTDAALKSGYSPSEVIGHLLSSEKPVKQAESIPASVSTSVESSRNQKTRAQKIAEMDAATDPMNPGYVPTAVSAGEVQKAKKSTAPERTWADVGNDALVVAGKGAVGLPKAIAGIADLAQMATPNYWAKAVLQSVQSGEIEMPKTGQISKALESAGIRFDDAQKYLDSLYSEAQQQANKEVRSAEGFLPTVKAAIDNPSVILTTTGESLPQMLGGASIARGALTMAPKLAPWAAGALGEGAISAGSAQSQIRSQTEDGLTTPKQSFAALATGTGTALIGGSAGKFAQSRLAQRLGVADIDTMLAAGKLSKNPAGFAKAVAASGISEGVFEELPQSVQEQILQNYALDKPLTDGVGNTAALGFLSGTTMGGTAGGFNAAMARSGINTPDAGQTEAAQLIADEVVTSEVNRAQRDTAIESIGRAESVDQAIESAKQALSVPVQSSQEIADRILEIEKQYAVEQQPQLDIEQPLQADSPFANDAVADVELARDGSLNVIGDTDVIVRQLEKAGVVSVLPTDSGVVVGPAEAAQAQAVLAQDVTNADLRNDGVASVEAPENAGPSQQTGSAADAVNFEIRGQSNTAQPAPTVQQTVASPGAAADASQALDTRFSFAGERAQTADLPALNTARERVAQGADPEIVRQETGWARGADGKWRFEIDDSQAFLKGEGAFGDVVMKRRLALEQAGDKKPGEPVRLRDVMYHRALFDAYPQIAETEVEFTPSGTNAKGRAFVRDDVPVIQVRDGLSSKDALSVILHEVQHGIQDVEGFAAGGNLQFASNYEAQTNAKLEEMLNSSPDLERAYSTWAAYQAKIEAGLDFDPAAAEQAEIELQSLRDGPSVIDMHATLDGLADPNSKSSVLADRYNRLAGEVEARNVQARQSMRADERRNTAPGSTEDVRRENQIVTRDAGPAEFLDSKYKPAPENQARRADKLLAAVRKTYPSVRFRAVAIPVSKKGARMAAVKDMARRYFGTDVVYVQFDGKALFNGAYSPADRETIFLNSESEKPHMAVLGHELLHHMRTKSPGIYADLSAGLNSLIKGESKYRDKLEALTKRKGGEMPADWREELHADIVGDYFTDPKFWEDLAKAEPSTFQKIANAVRQFLNTLLLKMRPFGTDAFLTDIQAARDVVSESMRKFSDAQMVNSVMQTNPATNENEVVAKQEIRYSNEEKTALKELSQVDELFALPKSTAKTIAEIVQDNDPAIQVRETDLFGEKMYTLTMGDGSVARITERPPGKYGPNVYGYDMENGEVVNQITERPGVNPEDAPNVGDVWIDVSNLKRTGDGAKVYNIAATYAHNTGKIFIGDPAGLSVTALRRRLEQMISSALKFGTTDHLAPHPSQVRGGNGVPGLTWVYGDSEGNLERMLAASVAALDNAFPGSNAISFDPQNGNFYLTATGEIVPQRELAKRLELARARSEAGGLASAAEAGWRTVARGAVFRALARGAGEAARVGDGRPNGVLDQLREYGAGIAARDPLDRIFYSRADGDAGEVETGDQRRNPTGDQLGFREPTTNSNGQPIARTTEALENFRKWFGDSKVVDADGRPLVMYHGTAKDFKAFDNAKTGSNDMGLWGRGHYFASSPNSANSYALRQGDGAIVIPAYVSIQNPLVLRTGRDLVTRLPDGTNTRELVGQNLDGAKIKKIAQDGDHDGVIQIKPDGSIGDVVAFNPNQIKSAIGNRGTFDPSSPDIRYSLSESQEWSIPEASRIDRLIYELQDSRIDLKRTQEAILGAKRQIEEKFDARLAETLYSGRVAYRDQQFLESEVEPLLAAMAVNRVGMNDLADYLHARGAEERNAQIARINPDLPDGGAGTNTQGVLMTNQAARDYLVGIPAERRKKLDFLASKVDAITKGTRELLVREGLEKPEVIQAWEAAYKNYVPMFRDEAESGNPHPTGGGFSVRGSNSKRATGSTKQVTNILAHVMMQRQAAITKAEKNRAALSLYGLALTNPNPEVWATIRPGMQVSQIAADLKAMGVDPVVAEAGMQGVPTVRTVDPVLDRVVDRPNPMYRSLPGALVVKIGGEDRVLMFNQDNPRALRMAESLKNLDGLTRMDLAGSIVGKATRWMASVNTQYNPAFGIVNGIRDTFGGAVNLTSTALRGKSAQVLLDAYTKAGPAIAKELINPGGQGEWAKLYRQFQEDGGKTGYREMFKDANDRAKALENQLKLLEKAGKLTPGKAVNAMLNLLDGFNTTIENAVRLSAYKNALDQGLSRAESARLARELTVDFNRKGRAGRELGPLYAFFNASVQGSARTLQALRGPLGAKIITGGLVLGAMQPLLLAMAGLDDDEIPEYVKTRAFIVPLFNKEKQYVTIPMPLGLHVIPNTGRVISELALNGGKEIGKRSFDAIGEVAGAFNPMGGGSIFTADGALRTMAPTIIDPFVEYGFNKNFAGNQIERETRGETDVRPGFARARESTQRELTGQAYLGISKAINKLTGGSEYEAGLASPSPEALRYFAQVVGGGVLREIEKIINLTDAAIKGDEVKQNKMPVVGRLFGEVDEDAVSKARFYEASKRFDKLQAALNAAQKAGDAEAMRKIIDDYPEIVLAKTQDRVSQEIAKLNKMAITLIGDREQLKILDDARVQYMKILNDAVREQENQSGGKSLRQKLRDKLSNPLDERQTSAAQ